MTENNVEIGSIYVVKNRIYIKFKSMSESLKQEIRIPIWMFSIMVTIMLAILAFNASYAGTAKQTETNTKSIELLNNQTIRDIENRKADKADVDRIYLKLDKIETLLIDHMNKK